VPEKGETIGGVKNFEFEVLLSDSRQLRRIKIKRLKQRKPIGPVPKPPGSDAETRAAE
jgi:Mg2+/Co2+ transporter CorC